VTECSFRFSRYDPASKQADGTYPEGTWTELLELVDRLGSREAALAVYQPVEDVYVKAVLAVLHLHGAERARLTDVERNSVVTRLLVESSLDVPVPDPLVGSLPLSAVSAIVRGGLRGELWCQIRATDVDITFGFDLYVHVRSSRSCDAAKELVADLGLHVQDADYPVDD